MSQLPPMIIAISSVMLCGSTLSLIGSGLTLICYMILPFDHHFRHILILNLTVADFTYALNHTIGGIHVLAWRRPLEPGLGCTVQGFIDQISVQAVDYAVLAITVATVFTVTRRSMPTHTGGKQRYRIVLMCLSIWAMPFFAGFLALGKNWYMPSSVNWCWIKKHPIYLRILLGNGWRMLFIIIEICLYTYLHFFLRRHYRHMGALELTNIHSFLEASDSHSSNDKDAPTDVPSQPKVALTHDLPCRPDTASRVEFDVESRPAPWSFAHIAGLRETRRSNSSPVNSQHQKIQRVLLLNAYPLAYIILWIPGIVNRLMEASGHSSYVAQMFQATTQLVGLANALTFGWNERVFNQLREQCSSAEGGCR